MTLPITFPDWVPWWVQSLVAIVAVLFGLALLLMPFSVFGTKSRLELLEARLEDMHQDLRALVLRLPDRVGTGDAYDGPLLPARPREEHSPRPPVPPPAYYPEETRAPPSPRRDGRRVEPRLD